MKRYIKLKHFIKIWAVSHILLELLVHLPFALYDVRKIRYTLRESYSDYFPIGFLLAAILSAGIAGIYYTVRGRRQLLRSHDGQCVNCGYSLHGLENVQICPECGTGHD
jgi:ribosomal protein S27AE